MIFTSIENRYNIKIERIDDNSFKFELEDLHENLIYEKNVFEDDLKNGFIQEIQKYILFIQRCFLQKENYIFKIEFFEESSLLHSFKKCKIFFKYEIDNIININSELILDERIEDNTQKEDRLLEHKIEELNKKIEDLNIQLDNKNRIIQSYESEFDLPEVLSKTELLKIVNEENIKSLSYPSEYYKDSLPKFKEFIADIDDYIVLFLQTTKIENYLKRNMYFFISKKGLIIGYAPTISVSFNRFPTKLWGFFGIVQKNKFNKNMINFLNLIFNIYFETERLQGIQSMWTNNYDDKILEYSNKFYTNILLKLP